VTKSNLTAVSLFSGCGGFDYGAFKAGVEIIWANDIDPHAAAAYRKVFPDVEFKEKDISEIRRFPRADVLIGCYPCTGFSLASRRKWKNRTARDLTKNGTNFLFREFLRAVEQVKPKYIFVENVPGMATAKNGWFFQEQKRGFEELGFTVTPKLIDTSMYGVPQTRKRIFIVGVNKRIKDFAYVFPKPTRGQGTKQDLMTLRHIISGMDYWPDGEFYDYRFHGHYLTRNRKRSWDEPSYTIVADAHHIPLHPMGKPMKYVKKDTWKLQGDENRRLSWRECAKIQGLPASAIPSGDLFDKYRVIGNSVPPAVSKAILKPVVDFELGIV
jgi:DNA (cytosine-5)-methyltransferase 1